MSSLRQGECEPQMPDRLDKYRGGGQGESNTQPLVGQGSATTSGVEWRVKNGRRSGQRLAGLRLPSAEAAVDGDLRMAQAVRLWRGRVLPILPTLTAKPVASQVTSR